MNEIDLIVEHVDAVHRWRVAKRQRRRWTHTERHYEQKARLLREELDGRGITVTLEKPKDQP